MQICTHPQKISGHVKIFLWAPADESRFMKMYRDSAGLCQMMYSLLAGSCRRFDSESMPSPCARVTALLFIRYPPASSTVHMPPSTGSSGEWLCLSTTVHTSSEMFSNCLQVVTGRPNCLSVWLVDEGMFPVCTLQTLWVSGR